MEDFVIEEPVYNTTVFVFSNVTKDNKKKINNFNKVMQEYNAFTDIELPSIPLLIERGARGYTRLLDNSRCVLLFMDKKPCQGVIAHECLHASTKMLYPKGIDCTNEEDEAYCYFLQYLVRKINEGLKRGKRK